MELSAAGLGVQGAVEPLDPPIFGRSVNPIPTGKRRLSPPNTTATSNVFHLPASLDSSKELPTEGRGVKHRVKFVDVLNEWPLF